MGQLIWNNAREEPWCLASLIKLLKKESLAEKEISFFVIPMIETKPKKKQK